MENNTGESSNYNEQVENKENIEKRDKKKVVSKIFFIISLVLLHTITFFYGWLFLDSLILNKLGWGFLGLLLGIYIGETLVTPVIRTAALVTNVKQTKVIVILNIVYTSLITILAAITYFYYYPSSFDFAVFIMLSISFIMSIPINVTMLIKKQTFNEYAGFYKITDKEEGKIRRIKRIKIIITLLFLTIVSSPLIFNLSYSAVDYVVVILIGAYYLWFITCEIILKVISKKSKLKNTTEE